MIDSRKILTSFGLPVLFLFFICCATSSGEEVNCSEIHAIAKMAKAGSAAELMKWKSPAGDSYRAEMVFRIRSFELNPHDRDSAAAVLKLIPKNQEEDSIWHEMGDSLCETESFQDMKTLGNFGAQLPRELASAVLLDTDKMLDYVSYATSSCGDPDSDYAVQMKRVCRAKHGLFVTAVNQMPVDDRNWFVAKIFNPDGCRPLSFPEQ